MVHRMTTTATTAKRIGAHEARFVDAAWLLSYGFNQRPENLPMGGDG